MPQNVHDARISDCSGACASERPADGSCCNPGEVMDTGARLPIDANTQW
jgi:hypothetical protein